MAFPPDDVGGLHGREKCQWQAKAKVVGPVPLDVGQPLVHFDSCKEENPVEMNPWGGDTITRESQNPLGWKRPPMTSFDQSPSCQ